MWCTDIGRRRLLIRFPANTSAHKICNNFFNFINSGRIKNIGNTFSSLGTERRLLKLSKVIKVCEHSGAVIEKGEMLRTQSVT